MKKCPQCGSGKLTEIAPNNGRRQWLCSDCGKVSRSAKTETPKKDYDPKKGQWTNRPAIEEQPDDEDFSDNEKNCTEEKAARSMCDALYKIWILAGVLLCSALVITGMVSTSEPGSFLTFMIYAAAGGLSLLSCVSIAAVMRYLAAKK